jgi:hypothetical protein
MKRWQLIVVLILVLRFASVTSIPLPEKTQLANSTTGSIRDHNLLVSGSSSVLDPFLIEVIATISSIIGCLIIGSIVLVVCYFRVFRKKFWPAGAVSNENKTSKLDPSIRILAVRKSADSLPSYEALFKSNQSKPIEIEI